MLDLSAGPSTDGIIIRRTISLEGLPELAAEIASSEDGIMLNHSYFDVRSYTLADALSFLDEEADLLNELAAAGWASDEASEVLDSYYESASELVIFDAGMTAAVFALVAAGATPISSCNGGLAGHVIDHAETHPCILFAGGPNFRAAEVHKAAEQADLGLLFNAGFAELFGERLLKFHQFARALVAELQN